MLSVLEPLLSAVLCLIPMTFDPGSWESGSPCCEAPWPFVEPGVTISPMVRLMNGVLVGVLHWAASLLPAVDTHLAGVLLDGFSMGSLYLTLGIIVLCWLCPH